MLRRLGLLLERQAIHNVAAAITRPMIVVTTLKMAMSGTLGTKCCTCLDTRLDSCVARQRLLTMARCAPTAAMRGLNSAVQIRIGPRSSWSPGLTYALTMDATIVVTIQVPTNVSSPGDGAPDPSAPPVPIDQIAVVDETMDRSKERAHQDPHEQGRAGELPAYAVLKGQ
jgi:hypothetical protein